MDEYEMQCFWKSNFEFDFAVKKMSKEQEEQYIKIIKDGKD